MASPVCLNAAVCYITVADPALELISMCGIYILTGHVAACLSTTDAQAIYLFETHLARGFVTFWDLGCLSMLSIRQTPTADQFWSPDVTGYGVCHVTDACRCGESQSAGYEAACEHNTGDL